MLILIDEYEEAFTSKRCHLRCSRSFSPFPAPFALALLALFSMLSSTTGKDEDLINGLMERGLNLFILEVEDEVEDCSLLSGNIVEFVPLLLLEEGVALSKDLA